jgi:hypothetical protein
LPPADVVRHLDRVLKRGALNLLRDIAAAERPARSHDRAVRDGIILAREVDDTDRRDVLRAVAVGFGAALAESSPRLISAADDPPVLARVGISDVQALEEQALVLEGWDRQAGGATTRHAVLGTLRGAVALKASSCAPAVRARLVSTVAYIADLAAWAVGDAGLHQQARGLFTLGIAAAREAGDMGMLTHVASGFARLEIDGGRPADAVDLIRLAQSGLYQDSPPTRSMLFALRAMASAKMAGGGADTGRYVRLAEDSYASPADRDPTWISYYTPAKLDSDLGAALLDSSAQAPEGPGVSFLSRLSAAVSAYPETGRARSRAIAATRLANALYLAREPEEASRRAQAALAIAEPVRSARLAADLRTMSQLARRYPGVAAAQEVRHGVGRTLSWMR